MVIELTESFNKGLSVTSKNPIHPDPVIRNKIITQIIGMVNRDKIELENGSLSSKPKIFKVLQNFFIESNS